MIRETARAEIFARIRAATPSPVGVDLSNREDAWSHIARDYRRTSNTLAEDTLRLFEHRLRDYDARVERIPRNAVARGIEDILRKRGNPRMLLPAGFPEAWRPSSPGLEEDASFTPRELDAFDGVLTGATLGIAETGTLVLQHGPGQGRRAATLVPDFHLAILRASDVVASVPEAFDRLLPLLPTTFISGPSATADIEMTRIKGVHGPRHLHVLLVE